MLQVMTRLRDENLLNDTFVIFTSDHGYHLGTFGLTIDKRFDFRHNLKKHFKSKTFVSIYEVRILGIYLEPMLHFSGT